MAIVLLSISLFTVSAYAAEIHFDQTNYPNPFNVIRLDHSDVITYTSTGAAPTSVTISGGTDPVNMVITLDQMPGSTTVWRKMVNFTTCSNNDVTAFKYCVQNGSNVRVSMGSLTATATISSQTSATTFGTYRSVNNPPTCADSDLDGICDSWESSTGISIPNPNGTAYTYTCPSNNPCGSDKKDIFVEIDYMQGHRPNQEAINAVVASFAAAPSTPAGGIRLHVQIDDAETGMGHTLNTIFPGGSTAGGFDTIKGAHFGTLAERSKVGQNWDNNSWKLKKQAFHYFLFAHSQSGSNSGASGNAEILGNDGIITLGPVLFDGQIGSPNQQAGTLMHELGHNLNLNHGGAPTDTVNCKPNYLSVMSYSRQFPDLITDRPLDFSHSLIATLNELSLIEPNGVGPSSPTGWKTVYGPPTALVRTTGQAFDWNRDGSTGATGATGDINYIGGVSGCTASTGQTSLTGHDDWGTIDLVVKDNPGNYADGRSCLYPDCAESSSSGVSGAIGSVGDTGPVGDTINEISPVVVQANETSMENLSIYNMTNFQGEFSSDDELAIRLIRIDQLEQEVKSIDDKFLDAKSKANILQQYSETRFLIKDGELALAYQKLHEINYNLITNSTIAEQLNDETNDVNKMFSEAPPKILVPPSCSYGEERENGVCHTVTDWKFIIIAIVIIIIIFVVVWRIVIRPRKPANKGNST
jgi:hypothetical protein